MRLIVPCSPNPRRLGLLPGGFNPPTRAHVAIAEAALEIVDQVLFVLPEAFPHKRWDGATPEQRLEMLRLITRSRPRFGVAKTEGGLFTQIAAEAGIIYPDAELYMICGRDAAERIIGWNYGDPDAIMRQLQKYHLLVAPRGGCYQPPPNIAHAVHSLVLESYDEHASTRVRTRAAGWRDLIPEEIADLVDPIYQGFNGS